MATFLQYRRLGKEIEKQLAADFEKARELPCLSRQKTRIVNGSPVLVVEWDGPDDPENPHNWTTWQKFVPTFMVTLLAWLVGACAPIDSPIFEAAAAELHVSVVAESLSVGMFLIGFGCGALVAGPFSEVLGRSKTYIVMLGSMCVWLMASALAPNYGAQLVFRFLAGFSGATPLVCAGGTISDMWTPMQKTVVFPFFAIGGFGGPVTGPVMSAWIPDSPHLHTWRWSEWVALLFSGVVFVLLLAVQPETYTPVILSWKAKHLRRTSGDDRYFALHEIDRVPLAKRLTHASSRPFVLAWHEPVIQLCTLYLTVVYIVLFTFFDGYDVIFKETYGLSTGTTNTLFVAIAVGVFLGLLVVPVFYSKTRAAARRSPSGAIPPETRLWFAMLGAPAVPVSLFWMAWTCYPSVSLWCPLVGSVLFGYGVICVFISVYMYLIDSYVEYAASGLTFITLVRYTVSGAMTVAGVPFYRNLGSHWTLTVLACVSVLLTPLPYLFYRYGRRIRQRSKFAFADHPDETGDGARDDDDRGERDPATRASERTHESSDV